MDTHGMAQLLVERHGHSRNGMTRPVMARPLMAWQLHTPARYGFSLILIYTLFTIRHTIYIIFIFYLNKHNYNTTMDIFLF